MATAAQRSGAEQSEDLKSTDLVPHPAVRPASTDIAAYAAVLMPVFLREHFYCDFSPTASHQVMP